MSEKKICNICEQSKPLTDFYKGQGRCKPCFLKLQKDQKTARRAGIAAAGKKTSKRAKAPKAGKNTSPPVDTAEGAPEAAVPAGAPPLPRLLRLAGGLGFLVELTPSDNTAYPHDLLITQSTEQGDQRVWLSCSEISELERFIAEHRAVWMPAS